MLQSQSSHHWLDRTHTMENRLPAVHLYLSGLLSLAPPDRARTHTVRPMRSRLLLCVPLEEEEPKPYLRPVPRPQGPQRAWLASQVAAADQTHSGKSGRAQCVLPVDAGIQSSLQSIAVDTACAGFPNQGPAAAMLKGGKMSAASPHLPVTRPIACVRSDLSGPAGPLSASGITTHTMRSQCRAGHLQPVVPPWSL